jgi:NADH-quinone oxidoreductase subunit H
VFGLVPGVIFLILAAQAFRSVVRMGSHPYFRFQKLGLAAFGAMLALIGIVLFVPDVRNKVQDICWFTIKVAVFMYLYIWYRGTFPRYRFDQLMKVGWKVLLPLGIGVLIGTAILGVIF